jgi:hypothetical protein
MIVLLAHDLSQNLLKEKLELDGTNLIELDNLRKNPLGAVNVSAEFESHLLYNYNSQLKVTCRRLQLFHKTQWERAACLRPG